MLDFIRHPYVSIFSTLRRAATAGLFIVTFLSSTHAQTSGDIDLIVRALELYRVGNCKESEPLLEKVLLHQPKHIAARKLLGDCYLKDKKLDEARIQFQLALDTAPQDVEALQRLRSAIAQIQKREQVKQTLALESRTATGEQFRSTYEFRRAEELIKRRRLGEAEQLLDGILERHPDSILVRQRLAEIYSATRRFDKAAGGYRTLADRRGASSVFTLRAAQNLEWGGNSVEAARYYRRYLTKNPQDSAATRALANVLNWSGHYQEAAPYYRLYLQMKPDDLDARMTLADVLMWAGEYGEALPELKRVGQKRPRDLKVQLAQAWCYEHLSEPEFALKAYERVLEIDPTNPPALDARAKYLAYLDELPRQKAFAALDRRDYEAAAKSFAEYLAKHPQSNETVLEIARVDSWGRRFSEAKAYYEDYLQRAPNDVAVRRELAAMEMGSKDYAAARKHYLALLESSAASIEDFESLIHSFTWAGDLDGAEPYAKRLAELDPTNPDARQTLSDLFERKKFLARTRADELAATGRFREAVDAYRRYMSVYGKTQQLELSICRLYSWGKDYDHAAGAYRDYLRLYPRDIEARLEWANIENWAGHYDEAETEYRAVLQLDPRNLPAQLGIAQVMDYRGDDPFKALRGFKLVLTADPQNSVAQNRIKEIHTLVAPKLAYSESSFWDSDGLLRSDNSVAATFSFPGRIKLTPFYSFSYFRQKLLNRRLAVLGNGGGGRLELTRSGWSLLGEMGATQFDFARSSLNARAELALRPGKNRTLGLTYIHRDAVYDVNRFASLLAGIMGDTVLISYQQPLGERVQVWFSGGVSHYSRGVLPRAFRNTQPRVSARLNFQLRPWLMLGYSGRATGFTSQTPLYFSPSLYQTHGLAYVLNHRISKGLRVSAEGELDYGRITTEPRPRGFTVNTFEMAVVPTLNWQVQRDIELRVGYRFSRGRGRAAGSPVSVYRAQGIEFSVSKVF